MFRRVHNKTLSKIVSEWDALAQLRYEQITSGRDVTYGNILAPAILKLVAERFPNSILDAGCGVGVLSSQLTNIASRVVAIDPSGVSINVARQNFKRPKFVQASIEEYVHASEEGFELIVANMVLMDVVNLPSFLDATRRLLRKNGAFVFSITHPCFWPEYYGYSAEPWFSYAQEMAIEGPFRTTYDRNGSLVSTHIHRPLELYADAFHNAGLLFEKLIEPMPSGEVSAKYPVPWRLPRYLVGVTRPEH
jgi:ubiquinone/menaquinone biosynthesis C-methylase UbiE